MNEEINIGKKALWIVTNVEAKENYTLLITFINGERKLYDALPLLQKAIYAPLKDISFFLKARVIGDTVGWNEEIDIAPEFLYNNSLSIK